MKIYALIPIKHQSERVPGKNYRDFNGKPLCYWIINTLLNSTYIDKIIIDTDSPIIKNLIPTLFNDKMNRIVIYDRPKHLHGGHVPTNDLFVNVINSLNLDADYYFQTHTTNPLLKTSTINDAIKKFIDKNKEGYETLFSVKTHHTRFYNSNGHDMNHNRFRLIPTQELEPIYEENSCMYVFSKQTLMKYKARIGKKAFLYKMNDIESTDIDWEDDFKTAELLHIPDIKFLLVTGANGGIGIEICKFFKNKNWHIIGIDLHDNTKHKYIDTYFKVNLTNCDDIKSLLNKLERIDCVINCAAYQCCKPICEYTENEWDNTYKCNVKSLFLITKYGLNIFKKFKTNIINIASIHASSTSKNISAYASSKAAIVGLTKNMAIDLAEYGIRVNSISPGSINTNMLKEHLSNERLDYLTNRHLLKTLGEPRQVAETCYFINNNTFFNGNNIILDGGILAQLSSE